jgi:hypothetical protein
MIPLEVGQVQAQAQFMGFSAMTLDEKSRRSFWQERNPSNDVFHKFASSYLFFRQGFNSIGMSSTVPNSICLSGLVHSFTSIFERRRR